MKNPSLKNSFDKTLLVIKSCTTTEQLEGAYNMVKNFIALYKKVGYTKLLIYKLHKEYNNKKISLCQ
tara:strand:+ start:340 stop:540 length:201 start_codon:yes stop_codon:yes gene_type:complete